MPIMLRPKKKYDKLVAKILNLPTSKKKQATDTQKRLEYEETKRVK